MPGLHGMGRIAIFNGGTGTQPFTNGVEDPDEIVDPQIKPSRLMGEDLMLLLLLMPPTNFRVESRTPSTALLVWTHIIVPTNTVEVDRALGDGSFVNIAILDGSASSYTDTGLAEGIRYRYRLRLTS